MDALDINFVKYENDITSAIIEVYGEEYADIILNRSSKIINMFYNNIDGIRDYYDYLKSCKERELVIKFFKRINVDVDYGENYAKEFPLKLKNLQEIYLGVSWSFEYNYYSRVGIKSFKEYDDTQPNLEKQLNFINYMRGNNDITLENYPLFMKTEEYRKIKEKIDGYLKIYEELYQEMADYIRQIDRYSEYVGTEIKRKKKIELRKQIELYEMIESELPECLKKQLDSSFEKVEDKSKIFEIVSVVEGYTYIELFSREHKDELYSKKIDEDIKYRIKCYRFYRLKFLEKIGIDVGNIPYDNDKLLELYDNYFKKDEIKKFFPPYELVDKITELRKAKDEEVLEEFICTSNSYIRNLPKLALTKTNAQSIYERMKRNCICVTDANNGYNIIPILFLTIRKDEGGRLDYIYLHELIHSLEMVSRNHIFSKTGFDNNRYDELNPYDNTKRKYEILNEIATDFIALKVRGKLHKKGIYFAEPKEIIADAWECNTCGILKNMVRPLFKKYHDIVLKARIVGEINILTDVIGNDNYEELNDCVNKVHYLLLNNLMEKLINKLINKEDNEIVREYYKQMTRLNNIYRNMEIYRKSRYKHKVLKYIKDKIN